MKNSLIKYCKTIGITKVGIADIGPYKELEKKLKEREEKGWLTGLEESDIQKRIDPKLTMENVKSIIVCLFPYHTKEIKRANLSNYTYSKDYHFIVKDKLDNIGEFLSSRTENFQYKSFVDTGPLVDRYLAYKAGLGFFGINAHLINDDYGTYSFIGYILVNKHIEPDKPLDKTCYQCMKCVYSCPGNVIMGDFDINPLKCRSYITQKKRDLDKRDIEILKKDNVIFGCDICQEVCPHNDGIKTTNIKEFREDLIHRLDYNEIKRMSNRGFKREYGNRAFAWRGRKILKRNHEIIHNIKDEDFN